MAQFPSSWGQWGRFVFHSFRHLPVEQSTHSREWRLAPMAAVGKPTRWQNMGRGKTSTSLKAQIYYHGEGDLAALEVIRIMGETRAPQPLILHPGGEVLGNHFLQSITRTDDQPIGGSNAMYVNVRMDFVRQGDE